MPLGLYPGATNTADQITWHDRPNFPRMEYMRVTQWLGVRF